MKTLILVTSHGLKPEQTNIFFQSLLNVDYTGYVGLISSDLRIEANLPFTVIHYPWRPTEYFRSSSRLFLYNEFLKKYDLSWDTIILTGIRDVLFQLNPSTVPHNNLDLFFEDESSIIGECPYNRRWILNSYGWERLQLLKQKRVICAEIVVGGNEGMHQFLRSMIDEAEKHSQKGDLEDQAMLNFLHHTGALKIPHTVWQNENSYVYTVGRANPILLSNHKILNRNLVVPHIIHQYDRHVTLP